MKLKQGKGDCLTVCRERFQNTSNAIPLRNWRHPLATPGHPFHSKGTGIMAYPLHRITQLCSVMVWKHFIWKPKSPLPFTQLVGDENMGVEPISASIKQEKKKLQPMNHDLPSFQICGRRGAWLAAWPSSTFDDTWGKKTAKLPGGPHTPPTSLKCAYPRPCFTVLWAPNPTFFRRKQKLQIN